MPAHSEREVRLYNIKLMAVLVAENRGNRNKREKLKKIGRLGTLAHRPFE
jgi:hypothetical protein